MTVNVRIEHNGGPFEIEIKRHHSGEDNPSERLGKLVHGESVDVTMWKGAHLEIVETGVVNNVTDKS